MRDERLLPIGPGPFFYPPFSPPFYGYGGFPGYYGYPPFRPPFAFGYPFFW